MYGTTTANTQEAARVEAGRAAINRHLPILQVVLGPHESPDPTVIQHSREIASPIALFPHLSVTAVLVEFHVDILFHLIEARCRRCPSLKSSCLFSQPCQASRSESHVAVICVQWCGAL